MVSNLDEVAGIGLRRTFCWKGTMGDAVLDQLLDKLSLDAKPVDKPNAEFLKELDKTDFTIFTPLSDHGFFLWKPPPVASSASHTSLADINDSKSIVQYIHWKNAEPPSLVPPSRLSLPRSFVYGLKVAEYKNMYPYGQYHIASLHVASRHRNVDLDAVDFVFGGSTLNMLAQRDQESPYMVTRIPGTKKALLVVKNKMYTQNKGDFGFQFERLVTGQPMDVVPDEVEFVEHLHLMQVGKYRVLFMADTDAVDDSGEPVEVTASNPYHWGTTKIFQTISNGCPKLCQGEKDRSKRLVQVKMVSLSTLARDALKSASRSNLEKNILEGMVALQKGMADAEENSAFLIKFGSGGLKVEKSTSTSLLPSASIVKELI